MEWIDAAKAIPVPNAIVFASDGKKQYVAKCFYENGETK